MPNKSIKPNANRYALVVGLFPALGSSGVCEKQLRVAYWLNRPFCASDVVPRELAISVMRVSGMRVSLHCRAGHTHHATAARHSPGRPVGAQVAK